MPEERFSFGPFCVDLRRREVWRDDKPVRLGGRAIDILCALVSAKGDLVTKDELMARVWPGTVVEENNLQVHVSALRRALDEGGSGQSCVVTVPGRGYRVIGIQPASQTEPRISESGSGPPLPDKPSIAVLPFINLSGDPEQEHFAHGIAEDIITALSRYPSLFVIARNSSFTYKGRAVDVKQIGRELGVRYVLEGSLRKFGCRIRATAQLVEAATGKHVWAERYDRDLADIFAMQDEITEASTIAIAPAIAEAERQRAMRMPPGNLDAWSAYQRGLWHFYKICPKDNALAQRYFQQAVDIDPNFGAGYKGLAWTHVHTAGVLGTGTPAESYGLAETLARQAIAREPTDAEAHSTLSGAMLWSRGDYEGALTEAERALTMSPNLAFGHATLAAVLIFSGRAKEGLAVLETSLRLDLRYPMMPVRVNLKALGLYFAGEHKSAAEAARQAVRLNPAFPLAYRWLAAALGQLALTAEAKEALDKAVAIAPASFDMYVRQRVPWHRPECYAHMLEGLRKAGWKG